MEKMNKKVSVWNVAEIIKNQTNFLKNWQQVKTKLWWIGFFEDIEIAKICGLSR